METTATLRPDQAAPATAVAFADTSFQLMTTILGASGETSQRPACRLSPWPYPSSHGGQRRRARGAACAGAEQVRAAGGLRHGLAAASATAKNRLSARAVKRVPVAMIGVLHRRGSAGRHGNAVHRIGLECRRAGCDCPGTRTFQECRTIFPFIIKAWLVQPGRQANLLLVLRAAVLAIVTTSAHAQPGTGPATDDRTPPLAIEAMTTIGANGAGYLADPQPVHLAPAAGRDLQILSGTTKAILRCAYPISPGCFTWAPITVDAGSLHGAIAAAGASITNFQNVDLFQDDAGTWHAVVTIGVHTPRHPRHWTVVAHAHPTQPAAPGSAPLAWSADTLLAGSFSDPVEGNYDAKYLEDEGKLYLLYVVNTAPAPALRNTIVIQAMQSPTQPAASAPVTLLAPGDRHGPLQSELYSQTQAKLVEAPYISRIGGKYALTYSTGAYLTPGYKAAVAWSDSLLPAAGSHYRKVLQPDPLAIWGNTGRLEVRYLVQSQKPRWPNFTGTQVIGPGVAAAVQGPEGTWWMFFNGFAPGDMPADPSGRIDADHRRPFALRLHATVPADRSVAQATDAELAEWLQPAVR